MHGREKEEAPGSSEAAPEQALTSSEALTKEDTLEDGGLKVISESFDLVRFHELHAPIPVDTVPKYKLVLTKDLTKTTYSDKLGFLGDYDIRSQKKQVTLIREDETCLFKPDNLSIAMETWPPDISTAAFSAFEESGLKAETI